MIPKPTKHYCYSYFIDFGKLRLEAAIGEAFELSLSFFDFITHNETSSTLYEITDCDNQQLGLLALEDRQVRTLRKLVCIDLKERVC